ncbi:MAG: PfkB family carbohydrate kinase [Casimicrobiaceae bacterium]|nr:PfkB family carbohydrate kinase [Casimicrobiaceae bacterium]MDW8311510.1 PfkB family carbohydrate kinase [Burkholderiales bacterium]
MQAAASPPRVVCLGVATLDLVFRVAALPAPPAKVRALDFVVTGGGMAANAAVAVARLGGLASYWGRLGDDEVGDQILRLLVQEGVDVRHVRRLAGARSKTAAVIVDEHGERLVVSAPSQGYPPDPSWLPLHELDRVAAVHADTRWVAGAEALFRAAQARALPSVFDGDSGSLEDVRRLSRAATHSFLSESMLAQFDPSPEAALRSLFGGVNRAVGATFGARGVLWFDGERMQHMATPRVAVIDTLAAGDTWHGALALALAEGQPTLQAVRFATVAAALKCTRFGGRQGIPRRSEVERALIEL